MVGRPCGEAVGFPHMCPMALGYDLLLAPIQLQLSGLSLAPARRHNDAFYDLQAASAKRRSSHDLVLARAPLMIAYNSLTENRIGHNCG